MSATVRSAPRYEIKAACQEVALERVMMLLRTDRAGLRTLYPSRRVQSVYLDTTKGRALMENLAGISHREKIRVRWYGTDAHAVMATLERKVRENSLGWKDTQKLAGPIDVEGARRADFVRRVTALADAEWQADLKGDLEPVQWVAYTRDYLRTADGKVRVTIDRDLRAADQRIEARLSFRHPTPLPRLMVLEAKCAAEDFEAAQRLMSRLPVFVDRCSKFVLASDREHGPVPSVFPL